MMSMPCSMIATTFEAPESKFFGGKTVRTFRSFVSILLLGIIFVASSAATTPQIQGDAGKPEKVSREIRR